VSSARARANYIPGVGARRTGRGAPDERKTTVRSLLCCALVAVAATGCAQPIQFVPATVPIENKPFFVLGRAHGSACSRRVLFIPIQFNEGIDKAYQDAIEDVAGAQGLIEASIDSHTTEVLPLVPVIYASHCTEISGKAIRFVNETPWLPPPPRR
jgi:hypothetical protein